jgi:hypothetical protein
MKKLIILVVLVSSVSSLMALNSFAGAFCDFAPQQPIAPIEYHSHTYPGVYLKITLSPMVQGSVAGLSVDVYDSKTNKLISTGDGYDADFSFTNIRVENGVLTFSENNLDQSSGSDKARCYTSDESLNLENLLDSFENPGQFPNGGNA